MTAYARQTMSAVARPPNPPWARRARPDRIRALYRGEAAGRLDEDLLLDVGWTLWARAKDVAQVSEALMTGRVQCPRCGGQARRRSREGSAGRGADSRKVRCAACGSSHEWLRLREALRAAPRCLDCGEPLRWTYAAGILSCPTCEARWEYGAYLQRVRGRKWLPCAHCGSKLREPLRDRTADPARSPGEAVACQSCGTTHLWRGVRTSLRDRLAGSGPGAPKGLARRLAQRRTAPCPTCGATVSRARDTVRCGECGWEGTWESIRRTWKGEPLMTGRGGAACRRFVDAWPTCRGAAPQMILVDSLLHELHDQGALGPLLVQGTRESVAELLDAIGGLSRRRQPAPATADASKPT